MDNQIPHLVTYPRSGSHYFDREFYKKAKFHIERSHAVNHLFDANHNKEKIIVTIVRDPKDSILSLISLKQFYNFTIEDINELISNYILLYSFLYEHADYIIDFNDLITYPEIVVDKMINILNINEDNYKTFVTKTNYNSRNFLESAKGVPGYGETELDDFNLGACYYYYNKILSKRIRFFPPKFD
jgi:hypothetical protein